MAFNNKIHIINFRPRRYVLPPPDSGQKFSSTTTKFSSTIVKFSKDN